MLAVFLKNCSSTKFGALLQTFGAVLTAGFENQVIGRRKPVKKPVGVENPWKPRRQPIEMRRLLRSFT